MTKKFQELDIYPGKILRYYSPQDTAVMLAQWLKVFGANRQGINSKAYLWHIFSAGGYPCMAGAAALKQYRQQSAAEYIVLPNDRKFAVATDILPESCDLQDYYVFPPNLAWTMAFTHEEGLLGPYFAQHSFYQKLHEDNQAQLRKALETEAARLKGWR